MRLLGDENFPKSLIEWLRADGHDTLYAGTDCEGRPDSALVELAEAQSRIVLTLDKDLLHIAAQRRAPLERAGVVLFRVHPAIVTHIEPLVRTFAKIDRRWAGHITIISPEGIQIVPARRR
jgi:predicted nuclease of predicted toxin-antitoxin system